MHRFITGEVKYYHQWNMDLCSWNQHEKRQDEDEHPPASVTGLCLLRNVSAVCHCLSVWQALSCVVCGLALHPSSPLPQPASRQTEQGLILQTVVLGKQYINPQIFPQLAKVAHIPDPPLTCVYLGQRSTLEQLQLGVFMLLCTYSALWMSLVADVVWSGIKTHQGRCWTPQWAACGLPPSCQGRPWWHFFF